MIYFCKDRNMQQDLHHEFFNTAKDENRENSHGSLRTKTEYGFLSVTRINKEEQKFNLVIFLPHIKDCISFFWSKKEYIKELKYPNKNITRAQAFILLRKALKKNKDNLLKQSNGFDTSQWEGVYLWRSRNKVGKIGIENFKKAFNNSIPKIFIDECKKSKITLKKYGDNPFKFSLMSIKKILN